MKRILAIILAVMLVSTLLLADVAPVSADVSNPLPMAKYSDSASGRKWCGPCSGVSIAWYYKTRDRDGNGVPDYPNLPSTQWEMYDRLHSYMDTAGTGYTDPSNYGHGFVEMALHYGYDRFSYEHYGRGLDGNFFSTIKEAIDNGWPVALGAMGMLQGFSGVPAIETDEPLPIDWPCTKWHWIAIKGYASPYMGHARVVICTDSYSGASNLYIDWDVLVAKVGYNLEAYIIKDVDAVEYTLWGYVEDFEWGGDGTRLKDAQSYGSEVDWEGNSPGGASVAEIDNAQYYVPLLFYGGGTRSARFYRDGSNTVYAYYKLFQPSLISFFLRKDDTACAEFHIGDGSKYIWVRIDDAEKLTYYGPNGYRYLYVSFPVNSWQRVEFKNINWVAGTYDIYIDLYDSYYDMQYIATATMRSGSSYKGDLYIGSWTGSGEFWIEDIIDSLRFPPSIG